MKKFQLEQYPYNTGQKVFNKKTVTFKPGVTVLVGCNGCGKSTMLRQIKRQLDNKNIPNYLWDDRSMGGTNLRSMAIATANFDIMSYVNVGLSEGETIDGGLMYIAKELGHLILNQHKDAKEFYILFDSIDSGYSIDNVIELKEYLFDTILNNKPNPNMNIYILVSANEYELANDEECLDVVNAKYITFASYDDYKTFIIASRDAKDAREEAY